MLPNGPASQLSILKLPVMIILESDTSVVRVCSLSCSTTVWGRGFPCQPYRATEAPVVSGPLIGRHSPAVLIPYAQGPGRGSGCIRKCCFHSTNFWVYSQTITILWIINISLRTQACGGGPKVVPQKLKDRQL